MLDKHVAQEIGGKRREDELFRNNFVSTQNELIILCKLQNSQDYTFCIDTLEANSWAEI